MEEAPKQLPWHRHLGHLEDHGAPVAHNLGADLHQPLAKRRQRPLLDLIRQRQGAQEVGEVVGERMKLQPHRVFAAKR